MLNVISGLLTAGAPADAGQYESIATVTIGAGGASSASFTSIAGTYKHLQIRFIANDSTGQDIFIRVGNGSVDTASRYARHYLYGTGSTAGAGGNYTEDKMSAGYTSTTANIFGAGVLDILDYANTSKNKTIRSLAGYDANGSGLIVLYSGFWDLTSAIDTITLYPTSGNFNQYSSFALYGIKG